jgi:hypothetical protein
VGGYTRAPAFPLLQCRPRVQPHSETSRRIVFWLNAWAAQLPPVRELKWWSRPPYVRASFSKKRECHRLRFETIKVLSLKDSITLFFNRNNQ